jgi:hypothetical protein
MGVVLGIHGVGHKHSLNDVHMSHNVYGRHDLLVLSPEC